MNEITLRNRRLGPEAAMQLAEQRAPTALIESKSDIAEEIEATVASFSSAAGLDAETVNGRPSFVPLAAGNDRSADDRNGSCGLNATETGQLECRHLPAADIECRPAPLDDPDV